MLKVVCFPCPRDEDYDELPWAAWCLKFLLRQKAWWELEAHRWQPHSNS